MKIPKRKTVHPGARNKFGSRRKIRKTTATSLSDLDRGTVADRSSPSSSSMRVTEFLRIWDVALRKHWRGFPFAAAGKAEMAMVKRFLTETVPSATNFTHADIPALVEWSVRNWDHVRRRNHSVSSEFSWPEIPHLRTFIVCWSDYLREWGLSEAKCGAYGDRTMALAHGANAAQADAFVQRLAELSQQAREYRDAAKELARCTADIRRHAVVPAERVARRLERALFAAREGYPDHVVARLKREVQQAVNDFLAADGDVPATAMPAYTHIRSAMTHSVAGDGSLPRELDRLRRTGRR